MGSALPSGLRLVSPDTIPGVVGAFLLCAGAAWVAIIVCRFVAWPHIELHKRGYGEDWPKRISFVDLAKIARSEFGWRFRDGGLHELDFYAAAAQAQTDGRIVLLGRRGAVKSDQRTGTENVLTPLDKLYFDQGFRIVHSYGFPELENLLVQTDSWAAGNPDKRYGDLRFEDVWSARRWLRTAESEKGTASGL